MNQPQPAGENAHVLTIAGIVHGMFTLSTSGLVSAFADSVEKSDGLAAQLIENFKATQLSRTLPRADVWSHGFKTGLDIQIERMKAAPENPALPEDYLIEAYVNTARQAPGADLLPDYTAADIGRFIRHVARLYLDDRAQTADRNAPPAD